MSKNKTTTDHLSGQ